MLTRLLFILAIIFSSNVFAAPLFTSCISDDTFVMVELKAQSEDEGAMIDLKVKSNKPNKPAEVVLPTRENMSGEQVVYTLLDSEEKMLIVEIATGRGKLSKGNPFAPNPYADVTCVKE
jgi:hypothetical protein